MDHLTHQAVERLAAMILVVGGAIFIVLSLRARPVRPGSSASVARDQRPATDPGDGGPPPVDRSLAVILAGLSGGAAVIHLVAAPSHYAEIGDLAAGFVVAALFQAAWIRWCLAGPGPTAVRIGIAGNLAIVAAWAWARTIGLPLGELAGSPEPVGYPDAAAVAFELVLVAGLALRSQIAGPGGLGDVVARRAGLRTAASIAIVPVVGIVLVLTSLATVAIASGFEHGNVPDRHQGIEHVATP